MIYLDDILELIEDVPDELQRRSGLIEEWERQACEFKRRADKLTVQLESDLNLTDVDKANLFKKIEENLDRARDFTEKKCEMANKCHQLLTALNERVSEWTYSCKLELEVDVPGSAAIIENNFLLETSMMATAAANAAAGLGDVQGEFRVPEERPPMREPSSSMSRESTPYDRGGGGGRGSYDKRTRESSMSSSRASSIAPFEQQPSTGSLQQLQRDRKRKRDGKKEKPSQQQSLSHQQHRPVSRGGSSEARVSPAPQKEPSAYMRRKREREREQRKLREVHANRERTSQQRVIKPEPYDDGYEQPARPSSRQQQPPPQPITRRPPGRPPLNRTVNAMLATATAPPRREEPERREEVEDTMNGGMSDVDDDDLLKFLNDEMPGGIADHDDLNLGLEDENLFDMASFGADLGKALERIQKERPPSPLGYGSLNAPSKSSGAGPSRYSNKNNPSNVEKKRQQNNPLQQFLPYAAGESLHGRQRKLTPRAEIHKFELEHKVQMRRRKEEEMAHGGSDYYGGRSMSRDVSMGGDSVGELEEEKEDTTPYCYCRGPSDGTMVGCEGKRCPYGGWFHLVCLHMDVIPDVEKWYCPTCRRDS